MSFLDLAGGLIGGLGGILGGNAQEEANEKALQLQYDMFGHMDTLSKNMYDANLAGIDKNRRVVDDNIGWSNRKAIDQANKLRNFGREQGALNWRRNTGLYKDARESSMLANRNALRNITGVTNKTYDRGLGFAANARDRVIGTARNARNQNIAGFNEAQDASLGYFDPYRRTGNNALAATAFNLGIGNKPAGYTGMELSEGTKFLMDKGRGMVEGSAAARGGLLSGATLEALEKERIGLAAQDKNAQMAQLMALGSQGMAAAGNMADIRANYSGRIAGERTNFADAAGAAHDRYGARGIALGENRADALQRARELSLTEGNRIRSGYADALAGVNDARFRNDYGIDSDFRNAMTNTIDTTATRRIGMNNDMINFLRGIRQDRTNLMGGAASNLGQMGAAALGNIGASKAMGWVSAANGVNNALSSWAFNRGANGTGGSTPPFVPPTNWSTPSRPSWF